MSNERSGKAERGEVEGAEAGLRRIAWELDYGVPVITRGWRKATAAELEAIAGLIGGKSGEAE
jgi:hypothetical protein